MNVFTVVIFFCLTSVVASCGESVFKLIPSLNNTHVYGWGAGTYNGLSVERCGEKCLETPNCASFSFRYSGVTECYIFEHRAWIGHNVIFSQRDDLVTYWKLEESCPSNYTYLAHDNICYKIYMAESEKLAWTDGLAQCQEDGGYLYIGNTNEKFQVLQNIPESEYRHAFIGSSDVYGDWKWLDGSDFMDDLWADTEPNGIGVENCAVISSSISSRKVADYTCETMLHFVCEIPIRT